MPFCYNTPSDFPFANYIINKYPFSRLIHPYHSLIEIGTKEKFVENIIQRNIYAFGSIFDKFYNKKVVHLSLNQQARTNMAAMHKAEANNLVPYRYNKSFIHSIDFHGKTTLEEFFLYSLYKNSGVIRDNNLKVFADPEIQENVSNVKFNRVLFESVPLNIVIERATELIANDPYIWCRDYNKVDPEWRL